jgi:hypothetical protein
MTHHAVGFSMPRDNQPPNQTAYHHLASQVVRVRETEENRQQPQKKQEGGVEQQQDVVDYHAMTASSSSRAAATAAITNAAAMGEQHTRESIARTSPPPTPLFNIYEYFQPVFDEVDNLNKMLDSYIGEENDKWKEKKK